MVVARALAVGLLCALILSLVGASADDHLRCPDRPRDCMALILSTERETDDSGVLVESWLYEDEDRSHMTAQMGGFHPLGANDSLEPGDTGGVVFRISPGSSDAGGYTEVPLRISFEGEVAGIEWLNGSMRTLSYDLVAGDEVYLAFPFEVTGGPDLVVLDYDVTAHEGTPDESTVSEMHAVLVPGLQGAPPFLGVPSGWFAWVLIGIILAFLLYGIVMSLRKP